MGGNLCREGLDGDETALKGERYSLLNLDFELPVGKGGYGRVWRCTLKPSNREVVVKEMNKVK